MSTTIYRIVLHNLPSERDLMTHEELGILVASSDPDAPRMRTGLPVFMSLSHARTKAKGLHWKGRCLIAEIVLPDASEFQLEQTGRHSRKHYTPWCNRSLVRSSIARIIPVKENQRDV